MAQHDAPLTERDVVAIAATEPPLGDHRTFRVGELKSALQRQVLEPGLADVASWFGAEGVACELLRVGAPAWEPGYLHARVQFGGGTFATELAFQAGTVRAAEDASGSAAAFDALASDPSANQEPVRATSEENLAEMTWGELPTATFVAEPDDFADAAIADPETEATDAALADPFDTPNGNFSDFPTEVFEEFGAGLDEDPDRSASGSELDDVFGSFPTEAKPADDPSDGELSLADVFDRYQPAFASPPESAATNTGTDADEDWDDDWDDDWGDAVPAKASGEPELLDTV